MEARVHHDEAAGPEQPVEEETQEGFDEDVEVTADNLLDQLRVERAQEADEERLIPVSGYERVPLFIKYKMIDGQLITKIGKRSTRIRDQWERGITQAIDVMIACAIGVYVEFDGQIQPLTVNGKPVDGFTPDLAQALGITGADTARQVVVETFKRKDLFIANHSAQLQAWLAGASSRLDQEFMGE